MGGEELFMSKQTVEPPSELILAIRAKLDADGGLAFRNAKRARQRLDYSKRKAEGRKTTDRAYKTTEPPAFTQARKRPGFWQQLFGRGE